jgi:hypothetical protein
MTELISAIESRAWYPVAGIAITLLLTLARRISPEAWTRVPRQWQWVPPVLLAALGGFAEGYSTGAAWSVALALAVYAGMSAGTGAIGAYHALRRVGGQSASTE